MLFENSITGLNTPHCSKNNLLQDSTEEIHNRVPRTRRFRLIHQTQPTNTLQEKQCFQWSHSSPYFSKTPDKSVDQIVRGLKEFQYRRTENSPTKRVKIGSGFRSYKIRNSLKSLMAGQQFDMQIRKLDINRIDLKEVKYQYNLSKIIQQFQKIPEISRLTQISREISFYVKRHNHLAGGLVKILQNVVQQKRQPIEDATQYINKLKGFTVVRNLKNSFTGSQTELQMKFIRKLQKSGARSKLKYCQICFDSSKSPGNQVKTCRQCTSKYHINCFKCINPFKNICQSCQERTSTLRDNCHFCCVDGLPLKQGFLKGQFIQYHPACLIIQGYAQYNRGVIQPICQLPQTWQCSPCQICLSLKGRTLSCVQCERTYHGLCAFFQGVSFEGERREGLVLQLKLNCCKRKFKKQFTIESLQTLQQVKSQNYS